MIRYPVVAGSFYPADPHQLQNQIENFLKEVPPASAPAPKAIIAPHAGYIYSGPIAASVYHRLAAIHDQITRVVLIGPSHRWAFRGLGLSRAERFATPLGEIPLDLETVATLAKLPFVDYVEQAHSHEHSLEVHLPFLQHTLKQFSLIPIVAGDASAAEVSEVLELLWGGPETLIVISSDLSHFHPYEVAKRLDQTTSAKIERLQYEQLDYESACGRIPISGLLALARKKFWQVATIDVRNSGDTAGDKQRVVGYGAYVIE